MAARGDAAVHDGREVLGLGEGVQLEAVLVEEGDVHQGLARLQHGLGRGEAQEAGHGAHHQVRIGHGGLDGLGTGEVRSAGGETDLLHAAQGGLRAVRHGDPELRGEILGHGTTHTARTKHDDMKHEGLLG